MPNLTASAQRILFAACREADLRRADAVRPVHVFSGILHGGRSVARLVLESLGYTSTDSPSATDLSQMGSSLLVLCQPTFASTRGCRRPGIKGTYRSLEASKSEHLPELGELLFGKRPRLLIQVGLVQADEPRAGDPVRSS